MSLQIDWDEHNNLLIRDVHQKWHEHIKQFMLDKYFGPNRIYKFMNVQDERQVEEQYLNYITHILKNECSVVVIDEANNEIHAVALVKWMTKEWKSWTNYRLAVKSPKLNLFVRFIRSVVLNYAHDHPDHAFNSLHLFEYYVTPKLSNDVDFIQKFFNAICQVARHMKMPRVTFVALSQEEQQHAMDAGWVELYQQIYSMYVDPLYITVMAVDETTRPFTFMRQIDEMYALLFEAPLEPLVPYYDMVVRWSDLPIPQAQTPKGKGQ